MTRALRSLALLLLTLLLVEGLAAQETRRADTTLLESEAVRSQAVLPREIRGIVLDAATGKPLSQAQVLIGHSGLGAITDSSGRFFIRDVRPGTHDLRAQMLAHAPTQLTVVIDTGSGWVVRFSLGPSRFLQCEEVIACDHACHSIAVYVRDVLTARPPGSPVALRVSKDSLVYWDVAQADSGDRALLLSAGSGTGTFTVEVAARGYAPWRRQVEVERNECGAIVESYLQVWMLPTRP